jgi:putative heme-binding domain-containing protein
MKFKLALLKEPALMEKAAQLTASLPAPDLQLAVLIAGRRKNFDPDKCSTDNGKAAFLKRCAVCHQIGTEGAKVGPQLDGVGIRGIDRLLEDILDPNRNVDPAFRQTVIETNDGRTIAGVNLRTEGELIILSDAEGKEQSVLKKAIKTQTASRLSLMPPAFEQILSGKDLDDVVAYLLAQTNASAK